MKTKKIITSVMAAFTIATGAIGITAHALAYNYNFDLGGYGSGA